MRCIIEEASWSECASALGSIENIDAALDPILEALSFGPEGFPAIPGFPNMRLAKTDRIECDDGQIIPALRVWFRYVKGESNVYLCFAEVIAEDEESEED